ncbi:MAG: ferredoxin--NADP reductase [Planctomycetota bacterium]|nr:MAG: ferredoxin--NADP reductase [Planctomycetota bacterium]
MDAEKLREQFYNATITELRKPHDDLMVLRVRPDWPIPAFEPGQYTVLGLGAWEPRLPGTQPERDEGPPSRLIRRAYSISCPLLDDAGRLVTVDELDFLEFYVALVRRSVERPPALTPRLFTRRPGDRLYCGNRIRGTYTLRHVRPQDTVVFAATGTGEAPHNAMIAQLLKRGHRPPIVAVTSVRYRRDLAYLQTHRRLQELFDNYRYLPLTTREPENLDPSHPRFVGKRHLQDYFESGAFERDAGITLDPRNTHVFLCGNPQMVGAPVPGPDGKKVFPAPKGMVQVLTERGFNIDRPNAPGNIHFERFW